MMPGVSKAVRRVFELPENWALWVLGDLPGMRKGIDTGLAHERSLDFLVQDGLWKLRAGDPAGARKAIEEALKIDPADMRALDLLNRTSLLGRTRRRR